MKKILVIFVLILSSLPSFANGAPIDREPTAHSLMFVENVGQFPDAVRFYVQGAEHTLWLTDDALWLTMVEPEKERGALDESETLSPRRFAPYDRLSVQPQSAAPNPTLARKMVTLKLSFPNAKLYPHLEPFDRLETVFNYYPDQNPDHWRANVPTWGGVRYRDLYPGLDLEITGIGDQWTWRLVNRQFVLSKAKVSKIEMRVEGADLLSADGDRLRLNTAIGELAIPLLSLDAFGVDVQNMAQPEAWVSQVAPETFDIAAPFSTAAPRAPLSTRDNPAALLASTFIGGDDQDGIYAIDRDPEGNIYATGYTGSTDLYNPSTGLHDLSQVTPQDSFSGPIFVTKLSADLSTRLYMTFLGSDTQSEPARITKAGADLSVSDSGIVYLTGQTVSFNFPATAGAFDTVLNDGRAGNCNTGETSYPCSDAFAARLSASGALEYATYLGGAYKTISGLGTFYEGADYGVGVGFDQQGMIYVVGRTDSTDFPTTAGAYDRVFSNQAIGANTDVFVVKLNPAGQGSADLLYGTFLGSGFPNYVQDMLVDADGIVYAVGGVSGQGEFVIEPKIHFPTTAGAYKTAAQCMVANCSEAIFFKLNPANQGAADLVYGTYLGGTKQPEGGSVESERAYGLALDSAGPGMLDDAVYITGRTAAMDFPTTPGAFMEHSIRDLNSPGLTKMAFVSKLNPGGNGPADLLYSTYLGGNENPAHQFGSKEDEGRAIAVDDSGYVYIIGQTNSDDFPTTLNAFDTTRNDSGTLDDAFITRLDLNASGSDALLYSTYLGGTSLDLCYNILVEKEGVVYVAGTTFSSDFPSTPDAYDPIYDGGSSSHQDGFISRLSLESAYAITGQVTDSEGEAMEGLEITANSVYSALVQADGVYTLSNLASSVYTVTPPSGYFWTPERRIVTLPPSTGEQNFGGRNIILEALPSSQGTVGLGSRITYTLRLIWPKDATLTLHDALPPYTRYINNSLNTAGMTCYPDTHIISGSLNMTAGEPVTVTFAMEVQVMGTVGFAPTIINQARICQGDICQWSNQTTNFTYIQKVYLPLVVRAQ